MLCKLNSPINLSQLFAENEVLKKKLESLSLALQAQEKENKILRLSISQSEGEIVRVKDLNRYETSYYLVIKF